MAIDELHRCRSVVKRWRTGLCLLCILSHQGLARRWIIKNGWFELNVNKYWFANHLFGCYWISNCNTNNMNINWITWANSKNVCQRAWLSTNMFDARNWQHSVFDSSVFVCEPTSFVESMINIWNVPIVVLCFPRGSQCLPMMQRWSYCAHRTERPVWPSIRTSWRNLVSKQYKRFKKTSFQIRKRIPWTHPIQYKWQWREHYSLHHTLIWQLQ